LVLYYFEEMTSAEIGSVLDLSESRVSQIHKEILQRLRAALANDARHLAALFHDVA
jgi:RNA polymerase sigma factor for flagellar operon FliA